MSDSSTPTWTDVVDALLADPDDDVTARDGGLEVRGTLFAFEHDGELVVDLPAGRGADLIARGIAHPVQNDRAATGEWVAVADSTDWIELAGEAHQFVGEPQVGGQS